MTRTTFRSSLTHTHVHLFECFLLSKPDHAVRMARFASECVIKVNQLTRELEVELGPGTGDLTMRFGLHSGPVTAGVLKGDRARFQVSFHLHRTSYAIHANLLPVFSLSVKLMCSRTLLLFPNVTRSHIQLFGDTVNTASRMESGGEPGRIQVSQSTADLIIAAGKQKWLTERDELIAAKGKGTLRAYWLRVHGSKLSVSSSGVGEVVATASDAAVSDGDNADDVDNADQRQRLGDLSRSIAPLRDLSLEQDRRIEWIVTMLANHIKTIVRTTMS
jgi:Adenylate and Guanylate cyclase catalytic domain